MSLTARHGAPARPATGAPLPLVVSGAVAGIAAALLTYLVLAVVALGAWMLDPSGDQDWASMLEAASGAWLAGLGMAPTVGDVTITLLPIGFAVLPILALVAAGRWAAEASAVARRGEAVMLAVAAAIGFALVAVAIAALARSLAVPLAQAGVVSGALAFTLSLLAVLSRTQLIAWSRLPLQVRDAAAAAAVALAMLVGLSSALLAASVIVHADAVTSLLVELDPGISGLVLLAVLTLGYLPTAIVWTMAYVIGPGVHIAVGTTLSAYAEPASAELPGFPLLAALPAQAPTGASALPIVVVVAGALAGLLLRRRGRTGIAGAAAAAFTAITVAGVVAALGWLAHGSLGTTSLQGLGPDPVVIGLGAGALTAIGSLLVVVWPPRRSDG